MVLVIRTFTTPAGSHVADVDRMVVEYERIEALLQNGLDGGADQRVTIESQSRSIELRSTDNDVLVGQFQLPVGTLTQIRIWPRSVRLFLRNGTQLDLLVDRREASPRLGAAATGGGLRACQRMS